MKTNTNQEDKVIENLRKCPRFNWCSINVCPLDLETNLRSKLPGEKDCPFAIKKRAKGQKGIKLLAPLYVLKVIPESNIKMLNNGNLKRWHGLHKKDGNK